MEIFKTVCVVFFIAWQVTSFIFGTVWLIVLFEFLYKKHLAHVELVISNSRHIKDIAEYLNGVYVPEDYFHYSHYRFPKKDDDVKGKKK